jgi:hypothetical protein
LLLALLFRLVAAMAVPADEAAIKALKLAAEAFMAPTTSQGSAARKL